MVSWRKNNSAPDNVANLLIFLCILDASLKDTALDGPSEDESWNKVSTGKVKYDAPTKRDWVAKVVFLVEILLIFGGRSNPYFWDIRLKIDRLPNFSTLFQLVLPNVFKGELFSCLLKVDNVIN